MKFTSVVAACRSDSSLCFRRNKQLKKLRSVMVKNNTVVRDGQFVDLFAETRDPDPSYIITLDNAKKMLAIHQRLR